jgi:cation-dependent mannose-6-phosphate receptor
VINMASDRQESMDLRSRGRKLVLQYTGGSPCGEGTSRRNQKRSPGSVHPGASYRYNDYSDEAENDMRANEDEKSDGDQRRKSTIISFLCDSSQVAAEASISFVGTDPDECAYFFEARSVHACVGAEPHKPGSIGPGGIFLLIFVIALLVYFMGGVFYQRTVGNARGWRQLPNYSLWAGIWSFISVGSFPYLGALSKSY